MTGTYWDWGPGALFSQRFLTTSLVAGSGYLVAKQRHETDKDTWPAHHQRAFSVSRCVPWWQTPCERLAKLNTTGALYGT